MNQMEISMWETENRENIIGWEVHYGYENKCKNGCSIEEQGWKYFDGYTVVIFNMKDKRKIEFKRENNETILG
jgi:hypothetical protein